MDTSRRIFIKKISFTVALLASGGIKNLSGAAVNALHKKVLFRFAIASDGHYGQPGTAYVESFTNIIKEINNFHQVHSLDCCIINGDIIHDEKGMLAESKKHLDKLGMPYFTAKGNHDRVSNKYWEDIWGTQPNHTVAFHNATFIIANTSNEKGDYLSPDLVWLKAQLEISLHQKNIFLVLHIPQAKWTDNAIDTPAFFELIKNYTQIKAVFHGHEHDQDGVKMHENMPFLFDSHFGGNWGTEYKGFRIVEILNDNTILTYMMNPFKKINELEFG